MRERKILKSLKEYFEEVFKEEADQKREVTETYVDMDADNQNFGDEANLVEVKRNNSRKYGPRRENIAMLERRKQNVRISVA